VPFHTFATRIHSHPPVVVDQDFVFHDTSPNWINFKEGYRTAISFTCSLCKESVRSSDKMNAIAVSVS